MPDKSRLRKINVINLPMMVLSQSPIDEVPWYICITFISSARESSQIFDVKVQNNNC